MDPIDRTMYVWPTEKVSPEGRFLTELSGNLQEVKLTPDQQSFVQVGSGAFDLYNHLVLKKVNEKDAVGAISHTIFSLGKGEGHLNADQFRTFLAPRKWGGINFKGGVEAKLGRYTDSAGTPFNVKLRKAGGFSMARNWEFLIG